MKVSVNKLKMSSGEIEKLMSKKRDNFKAKAVKHGTNRKNESIFGGIA